MNFSERTYRALRVGLLVFALCAAVCVAAKYSSRLELLSRVAIPTAAEQVTTQPSGVFWSEPTRPFVILVSAKAAPLTNRYLKRQTSVYAAVPTYQEMLLRPAELGERVDTESEPPGYASRRISQPADRGPPFFV